LPQTVIFNVLLRLQRNFLDLQKVEDILCRERERERERESAQTTIIIMGKHVYTSNDIYPLYAISPSIDPISNSACLSAFQRATFEIVIHIPYTDTCFGSITLSGSRAVPAPTGAPPPPIWNFFFHIVHYLDLKKNTFYM
jgi:hypothetical protein